MNVELTREEIHLLVEALGFKAEYQEPHHSLKCKLVKALEEVE